MKRILITGGRGFLGRNLAAHLRENRSYEVAIIDRQNSQEEFKRSLLQAEVIFHLAGVNRPQNTDEFRTGNTVLTEEMCNFLRANRRTPTVVFSSSIQADQPNPYGASKANAEASLQRFSAETGARVRIYRLKNLFGKWCRPNYNSVTATFCFNIANDLPIAISDVNHIIELSYVDDVVNSFLNEISGDQQGVEAGAEIPSYHIQLGDLAGRIQAFHEMRATLRLPDFADTFNRGLYATYLSYVPAALRQYPLNVKTDNRGSLAEFIKQKGFGQVFVSRTKPGITRGNHYHHTKTEKFLVLEGTGLIRMRGIEEGAAQEYRVTGDSYQVIDIPPGFTHSITNVGAGELVTLFWSSEIFDPDHADTYFLPVDIDAGLTASLVGRL